MGRQINQVLWKTQNCQCFKCDIPGNGKLVAQFLLLYDYIIIVQIKSFIKQFVRNFRVHINNIRVPHGNTNRLVQSQQWFTRTQKIKYPNYTFVVINTWSGYNSKKCPCIYTSEGTSKLHSTRQIIDFIIFSFQLSKK